MNYKVILLCFFILFSCNLAFSKTIKSSNFYFSFQISDHKDFPFNKIFSFDFQVLDENKKPIAFALNKIDATMPSHKHGMVTYPKFKKISQNKYKVDGFKFHMRGKWEILVDFIVNSKTNSLSVPFEI